MDAYRAVYITDKDNTRNLDIETKGLLNAAPVFLLDAAGDQITSFGTTITQYTEGDTDASITGIAFMWEDAGNVLRAISQAKPLPVAIQGTVTASIDASGLATVARQDTGNTSLATIAGAIAGTEMQVDVLTMPTVTVTATNLDIRDLTSVSDSVSAVQSGTWNITNVSGTVSLPTGASTLAEQQTQTTHLATIAGDTTSIQTAVELIDDTVATLGTTTYAETTTKGLIIGAVRRDADTTLVDTTNEVGPLQMNAAGQLKVEVFSGETLPVSLTSTTITGTVAVTQSGTWDEIGINDSGNSITVDNGGTFAVQATLAAGATSIGKAEDVASADADVGVPAMAVQKAIPVNTAGADGDYEFLQISAGRVWASATIDAALPTGTNTIGSVKITDGTDVLGMTSAGNAGVSFQQIGNTSIASNAGAATDGTLRTISASDDPGVASLATINTAVTSKYITGIGHGVKVVAVAGTDEALAGSTACKRVVVQAQTDNTTGVAVGATGVDATIATGTGTFLYPGDSFELEIDNLADVFVDALTSGEGVRYTYFTQESYADV